MGMSVITVRVVGNHGCQREVKNGGIVAPACENGEQCAAGCVDAQARAFVEKLKSCGSVEEATIVHWPGSESMVIDNLKSGKRTGSF